MIGVYAVLARMLGLEYSRLRVGLLRVFVKVVMHRHCIETLGDGFVVSDCMKLAVRVIRVGISRRLMQSRRLVVEFRFRVGKDLPVDVGDAVSCFASIDGSEVEGTVDVGVFVMDMYPL